MLSTVFVRLSFLPLKSQIVLVFLCFGCWYCCWYCVVGFGTKLSTISFWRHINININHPSAFIASFSSSSSYLNPQLPITISRHSSQYWLSTRALSIMVTFLCDGCNETIKKNKVDAHAAKCRSCYAVSCVDCSVSFPGG